MMIDMEGKVVSYHVDQDQNSTTIREYIASNSELEQLYDFLTLEAIERFEMMPTSEKSAFACGYYDCADLRYLLIASEDRISDGSRHGIYSNDPINMAIKWTHSVTPSAFWR